MHRVENPSGRLVTFRVELPVSDENGARAAADLRAAVIGVEGRAVIVSDLSAARTFSPETAERFVALMRADNPKIERSALLTPAHASTLTLQIARMLKEAENAARRFFVDPAELRAWLAETLDAGERSALEVFLETRVGPG